MAGAGRRDLQINNGCDGEARSFEALDQDIGAAVDALVRACPDITRVALWGLCDGASAALLYRYRTGDKRVVALGLVNPWVRSEATLARARMRHYYLERLADRRMWADLFGMRMRIGEALADLWRNWRRARRPAAPRADAPSFREEMAAGLGDFRGTVLLILSGRDATAQEFRDCIQSDNQWKAAVDASRLTRVDLAQADHTFTDAACRMAMESATSAWLRKL
jgi:exosortase A-associated hydrolase 1